MQPTDAQPGDSPRSRGAGTPSEGAWASWATGGRGWDGYLADLLAALLMLGGIGWLLDRWLSTDPWLTVIGIMLGNACGLYLIWLRSNEPVSSNSAERQGKRPDA